MQEYKYFLDKIGNQIDIINNKNVNEIIAKINNGNYDFVHLHAYKFVSQFILLLFDPTLYWVKYVYFHSTL